MSYEVVWDGSHRGEGRDSLLPPRDERTNAIWSPDAWEPDGTLQNNLWSETHPRSRVYRELVRTQRNRVWRETT
jgi:hypothetical protein